MASDDIGAETGTPSRDELSEAMEAVRAAPGSQEAWDHLEDVAASAQRPEEAAELYRTLLGQELPRETSELLCERAVGFHEEWFGEDSPLLAEVLGLVLDLDPLENVWAFQRLTVVHTIAERWNELLALYDRTIASAKDDLRKESLLEEAAQTAKDFAGQPDRAIDYLRELVGMRPGDAQLTGNLERLLERQGRWRDLIDFLHQQIEGAEPAQVREVRLRIAGLWLNEVGDRARVVEELRALLADPESGSGPDAEAAIALLQRIVADEEASPDIRGDAAGLLRERFAAEHRISDVVGALDAAIAFADSYEKVVLHREAAQHLEEQGKLEEALDHWFEVVRLAPDEESRQKLAELAGRTGKESRRIALLLETAAAMEDPLRRASLRIEAAETRRRLEEPEGAIELYELVLGEETLGEELARACAIELAELYAELGRSAKQLEALERLATLEQGEGRREVLGRVATLAAEIGQADRALAALSMRLEADEADHEALAGTIRILESEERWAELAAALSRRLARPSSPWQRRADLVRKASVEADRLEQIAEAIETWRQIVDGFGENEETVDALSALYDRASRWEDFADVLGRAADREDAHVATVRVRLGDVYREQLGDPARSVREYGRALECEPRNEAARAGLLALAEIDSVRREATEALARNYRSTDDWAPLLELLDRRMELAPDVASRLDLLDEAARLQSERADNSAAAAGSMARALLLVPSSRRYEAELLRLAEAAGAWDLAADAFRGAATEASEIAERRGELLSVEARLREERLGDAAGALIPAVGALRAEPHRLEYAQRVVELARAAERLDVAEAALSASVEGAVAIEQLDLLAELRRAAPSRALYELLLRIAEQEPSRLGELREASELALGTLEDSRAAAAALERLYLRASTAWRRGAESSASEHALWSFERLVELDEAAGRHAALVDRLSEASRLPIEPERSLALRRRAASITHRELGDRARSMDLYRDILAVAPDDLEAMSSLGELLEEAERWPELLGLRRLELSKTEETAARLELRLKIAALIDRIDADGGRIESLSRNLGEQPGHPPTIEALEAVLDAQRRYEELAQLLASQAKEVEPELAVRLWRKLADVSERKLEDTERALEGWRRVAELSQSAEAYEALARIHEERGEPIPASRWLERRLATASEGEKASAALALSRVLFAAARGERAAEVLEQARLVDPEDRQVRDRLASYYRKVEAIEPLARVLGDAALQAAGHDESLGLVREAATLYCDRLGMPSEAVAILERGVELAPDDRDLRTKLAEGLEQSGRLDEARVVLEALVESYGRRRSSERAHAHFLLGRVLGAQGNLSGALEQADLASKMARASAPMLQMFARLARQAGELDRAEKAYRTLLMTVRRRKADEPFDVGAAEVLYELSVLATEKGDADQANDLLESAMETASQDDVEAERLVESLLARGDAERALLALERRLETATQPPSRARILTEMAGLLDANLGRPEDAFGRCLEALQIHPNHEGLLDSARALASKLEQTSRYLGVLEEILANRRRDEDAGLVALLLVHQGQVLEEDAGDAERAAEIYRKAEQAGQVLVPARLALARLSARRGDTVEQERVLRLLIEDETVPETEQANARYRLAALLLQAERIDEGIETLRAALTDQPRFEEAAQILAETAQRDPNADAVMAVYEDVARGGGDEGMLLDYLERRASREDVTLAQLREAIDKALSFPAPERAEALLERAVKVAEAGEGLVSARWAPAHLAQLREAAGDIPGATGWTERLLQIADPEELRGLRLRLAELASRPGGDLEIAARSYEELLEEDVSARAVWEPLLGVYRSLGDEDRLGDTVSRLVDALLDPAERNVARMEQVRFLLGLGDREFDAADVLRTILEEAPDDREAATLLTELYEKSGYSDELVELLERQLDVAKDGEDLPQIIALSLRMGQLLEKVRRDDALDTYRRALDWAPTERSVIEAFLAIFDPESDPREQLEMRERLLASEQGQAATELALALNAAWLELEDEESAERVLMRGYHANPADDAIRQRVEARLREREDWEGIAAFLSTESKRLQEDPEASLAALLESAAIHRDRLGNAEGAVEVLRGAAETNKDIAVLRELVSALEVAGRKGEAIAEVEKALEHEPEPGSRRAQLLRMRAGLRLEEGELAGAVEDLEAAYREIPDEAGPELLDALRRAQQGASDAGELELERAMVLRLFRLLFEREGAASARVVLEEWTRKQPADAEALGMLRDLDVAAENWEGVTYACELLIHCTEGQAQLDCAMLLADAAGAAGEASRARAGLEQASADQPKEERITERLMGLYEEIGANLELAHLLLREAEGAEPEIQFAHYRRAGRLFVDLGDGESGVSCLEAAARINPEDHATIVTLVDSYLTTERYAEAGELLEQAIGAQTKRRSPELSELQHRMARLAALAGDRNLEMQWLAAGLDSDKNNIDVAAELAYLSMELGELDVAMNALRAVTLSKSDGPMSRAMAFLLQARIAHQRGEGRRALLWARKAKSEDPELKEVHDFLDELGES